MKQALTLYSTIASAEELNESERLELLKIAVLGGLDGREISQRLGLEQEVIEAWEKIYFDVRGMREAVGWIHLQVIQPERNVGREDLAARLKLVAAVGPLGARAVLDLGSRAPLDEGQRLFDRRLKLHLKFDAAVEMSIESNREKMFFLRTYADMRHQENHLRCQEQRLQRRCQEALDRLELRKIRLELAHKRAERREAARDRREQERRLIREAKAKLAQNDAARRKSIQVAEALAAAARATAGPLAQLTWHKATVETTTTVSTLAALSLVYSNEPRDLLLPAVTPDTSLLQRAGGWDGIVVEGNSIPTQELVVVLA